MTGVWWLLPAFMPAAASDKGALGWTGQHGLAHVPAGGAGCLWPRAPVSCPSFLPLGVAFQEREVEATWPLRAQAPNSPDINSATFYWLKQVRGLPRPEGAGDAPLHGCFHKSFVATFHQQYSSAEDGVCQVLTGVC